MGNNATRKSRKAWIKHIRFCCHAKTRHPDVLRKYKSLDVSNTFCEVEVGLSRDGSQEMYGNQWVLIGNDATRKSWKALIKHICLRSHAKTHHPDVLRKWKVSMFLIHFVKSRWGCPGTFSRKCILMGNDATRGSWKASIKHIRFCSHAKARHPDVLTIWKSLDVPNSFCEVEVGCPGTFSRKCMETNRFWW